MHTKKMKEISIKILYDNCKESEELQNGWGFSALIEFGNRKILFDTGKDSEAFLSNAKKMQVDLQEVSDVIFSHKHSDHTAGCREILEKLKRDCQVHLPKGFPRKLVPQHMQIHSSDFQQIDEGIFTMVLKGGLFLYEQVLILRTENGLVIVTGCAHPGITHILEAARAKLNAPIHFVLGGFHLFRKTSSFTGKIVNQFKAMGVKKVAPCHCSGKQTIEQFKEAYSQDFYRVSAGTVLKVIS